MDRFAQPPMHRILHAISAPTTLTEPYLLPLGSLTRPKPEARIIRNLAARPFRRRVPPLQELGRAADLLVLLVP